MDTPAFQMQPLEVEDFSGGLTDNFFDSGPTRYAKANNLIITVDRKLAQRPGTVPFDLVNYLLPGPPRRVDALFPFINETRLLVNQGRDILALPDVVNPIWTAIHGPSGNEALGAGGSYSVVTSGEFQRQIYFASDAQPIPSRVYRDENNNYTARTAGLPRVQNQPLFNDVTLLVKCIANANALRESMISHFTDFSNTSQAIPSATQQHAFEDKWSEGFLQPVVFNGGDPEFPGPIPAPVPTPNATDLTTLLALVYAMNQAYEHHNTLGLMFYHFTPTLQYGAGANSTAATFAPMVPLINPTNPANLFTAATMLDDLYQKWYWHMLAVNLHGQGTVNDYALMSKYVVANPKIGAIGYDPVNKIYLKQPPTISPDYQDFYNYVNGLMALHNAHIGGGGGIQTSTFLPSVGLSDTQAHIQPDTFNQVTLPLITSIDAAYLSVAWMRVLYGSQHIFDSNNQTMVAITFDTTATSNTLTNVKHLGVPVLIPIGYWIYAPPLGTDYFTAPAGYRNVAQVLASGAGNAVLDRPAINTAATVPGGASTMQFHTNIVAGVIADGITPTPSAQFLTTPATSAGTDLNTWMAFATEYMYALFNHMSDGTKHVQGNFPGNDIQVFGPVSTPTVPQWYVPTVSFLAYAFTYYYKYTVEPNGIQYVNESNPVFTSSLQTIEPFYPGYIVPSPNTAFWPSTTVASSNPIVVTQIPAIVNDLSTNYDTANIDVRIYRTTNGGSTFYLLDSVDNGVTSYNDVTNSLIATPGTALLNTREVIYTSGGVVGNDQPPQAKYMHILNGVAFYGNLLSDGQYFPNRILQGLPNNPDSGPATFTDDLEDEVVGISSSRNNIIIFCKNAVYREEGGFNSLGQGQLTHEKISHSIGCVSAHSIVQTEIGVFFAGNDGFYYTDGFQMIKVSIDLDNSYQQATQTDSQKSRISGTYDKLNRRIWWTMQNSPFDTECDSVFIYYVNYGVKPGGVFTTVSNDGSLVPAAANPLNYQYWRAGALLFYQGEIVRGDERGLLFKTDPLTNSDPKIDLTLPASQWNTVPIPWNYSSTVMDFGTHFKRKWTTKINITGRNEGNASVQVTSNSDNGRVIGLMAPINYIPNPWWGNPNFVWGNSNCAWKFDGKLDFWRRFPATTLRANLKQIEMTPARVGIYRYEDFPNGSFASSDNVTKNVTIATPAGFSAIIWPTDSVDYYLALQNDGFVKEYLITQVVNAVMTVSDPSNTLPTQAGQSWVIRGYRKNGKFALSAYVIHFSLLGDKNTAWSSAADSGENT